MFSVFKFWIKHVTTSRRCLRRTLFQILWCVAVYCGNIRTDVPWCITRRATPILSYDIVADSLSISLAIWDYCHTHTRAFHTLNSWHSAWTVEIAHLKWKKYVYLTRANRHFNRPSMMHRRQLDTKIESDSSTSTWRCSQTHVALNVGILWHWSTIKLCSLSMRTTKKEHINWELKTCVTWLDVCQLRGKNLNSDYLSRRKHIFFSLWNENEMVPYRIRLFLIIMMKTIGECYAIDCSTSTFCQERIHFQRIAGCCRFDIRRFRLWFM